MKRLLLAPLLIALSSCSTVPDGVNKNAHKTCLKAADYVGCVESFSNSDPSKAKLTKKEKQLLEEIKKLPARMTRTSLANFQDNVREFVDALSLAKYESPDSEIVINAGKLLLAFDLLYDTWEDKIYIDSHISGSGEFVRVWDAKKSFATKKKLDLLFGGNTFDVRCVDINYVIRRSRVSDPIFLPVFLTVENASKQLARDGAFSFPSQTEEAAIPLVKTDLNAKFGGIGSKPCEFEK